MKIGIIGNGFVGKATSHLHNSHTEVLIYDIRPEMCNPIGLSIERLSECEIIFVCVPTPTELSGKCHLDIVENVISKLTCIVDPSKNFIVLRSTVPAGTSDRLGCYFMPEFLTEKNYIEDFINCPEWVFGLKSSEYDESFKTTIKTLFTYASVENKIKNNTVFFRTNQEAETIKYMRNCFLSTKVSFCNEVEEFCRKSGINYDNVRTFAMNDSRIGTSHTSVPGHDGYRGFGGTCFPKDMNSLIYQMESIGMKSYVLKAVNDRNNLVDRPDKDWAKDKGRSVV